MKYIITEKNNINSVRDGYEVDTDSITSAKKIASRRQAFYGTVLTIENRCGDLISYKKGGKWFDMFDHPPKSFKIKNTREYRGKK